MRFPFASNKSSSSYKSALTFLLSIVVLAAGFMVVSERAAGREFHWPVSLTRIFASRSTRALSSPSPAPPRHLSDATSTATPTALTSSVGDVAVDVANTTIKKLNEADGTVAWSVAQANDGALAVDQVDLGVYTGNGHHSSGSGTVYKYNAAGGLAWTNTVTGAGCNFYYVNGAAVDTTSGTPGVVFTETSCFGGFAKSNRTTGVQQWSLATNDVNRPSIDPADGQIYDITLAACCNYKTIYSVATTGGAPTSAASCEGNTDLNPADGMLYRGGNMGSFGCGLQLSQLNKSSLATPNWSMTVPGITSFDALAVQPWSGGYIYVASTTDSKIVVVNPATQTVVGGFNTAVPPGTIAVNPNGGTLYVASSASNFVYAYSPSGTLLWTSPDLGGPVYVLATPRGIVGTPPAPGEIEFTDSAYTVSEGGGTAAITVTRSGGSAGSITANFNTSDGTATDANNDYEPVSSFPVSYADGETGTKTVNVTINPDSVYEGNETVNLSLSGTVVLRPQGGSLQSATLTITNDDNPPTTLVVNTTADPGTGICDVTECTLREAITAANFAAGANTITFNIPAGMISGGVFTIQPTSALPTILRNITIDGTTQTVFSGDTNTFGPEVVLNGSLAGSGVTGLYISGDNNTIKGLIVNGFSGTGIGISYPLDATPSNNQILNNYIGTDTQGQLAVANGGGGVDVHGSGSGGPASGNTITGNTISGNTGAGIDLCDTDTTTITGNFIGSGPDGGTGAGNTTHGIQLICSYDNNNVISGNTVAFNDGNGFFDQPDYRFGDMHHGNKLSQNNFYLNTGIGINLNPPPFGTIDGITPNDPQDTDTGANGLQNFPVLSTATVTGSTKTITGTLNSTPGQTFTIEFFSNLICHASGKGEGGTYLGSVTTGTTDGNGDVSFTYHPSSLLPGDIITATATDTNGNTSEFSQCKSVAPGTAGSIVFTTSTFTVGEGGGMAAITVDRNGGSDGAITANFSTSNGSAIEPDDYTAVTNFPINYADGETGTKTVNVTIIDDSTYEGDETVDLLLDGTVVLRPQGVPQLTIVDNDAAPTFSISATSGHLEGDLGTSSFDFTVTKTGSTALTATVRVDTVDESAQAPGDYAAIVNQVLTFNPTDTTQTVNVTVNGDTDYEGSDVFFVDLSSPVNATIAAGQGRGVGTIINDDNPPAALVVTKTADTDNHFCDPANCSLREAIEAANFAADTNTITFSVPGIDPGCPGGVCTITETLGELSISQSVNINGTGANSLIVSGNNANRVFDVTATGTVGFSGLTIANGFFPSGVNGGGGISSISGGTVNISNSTLSGNSTPGAGGGIFSSGSVNVFNSTFSGNQAGNSGGGIFANSGTVNIINSTFSGNSTPGNNGGGIFVYVSATANITNCTFAVNSAEFGGGIYNTNTGVVNLRNTIVALNTTTAGSPDINNVVTSLGHNLLGKSNGSSGLTDGVNGDKVGTVAMPLDPQIGPLQNNGGPTFTRALLVGSPAIDAGDNCVFDNTCSPAVGVSLTTDQRGAGFPRQLDGDFNGTPTVDMGAFELNATQTGPAFLVNSTNDPGDGTCNSAECTLREAINAANANVDANTINFNIPVTDPGFAGGVFTIQPLDGEYTLTGGATTIDGSTQTAFTGDTNAAGPEIVIDGTSLTCGGTCNGFVVPSPSNRIHSLVINHFTAHGITMFGGGTGNTITGCYIGTDATGTVAAGNSAYGITSPGGNVIGGLLAGEGNVISGNGSGGFGGLYLGSADTVKGNKIGTNALGTAALANFAHGIAANVGGGHVVEGNLISGNTLYGIEFVNSATDGNIIRNNKIGTDISGSLPLGNGSAGIRLCCGSGSNTVGGSAAGEGNIIAFNGGAGVVVHGLPSGSNGAVNNKISGNSIFENTLLGIDLGNDGVTPNDPGDGDTDADGNNLQNFPVITSAKVTGNTRTISGTLNTTPNSASGYTIEFFANTACDATNGEGKTYLGSFTTSTTDTNGDVTPFTFHAAAFVPGDFITATATDSIGNTSEFSACFTATTGAAGEVKFVSATYSFAENAGVVNITVQRTGGSDGAISATFSTSDGTATDADNDYEPVSNFPVSYADGETGIKNVSVTINNDATYEPDETVNLSLSATLVLRPSGINAPLPLAPGDTATLTITNDDAAVADLSISKVDSQDPVAQGNNFTYTITITNNGPQSATNVVMNDPLPAGVTFISATPSQGSCTGTTTVNCPLGTIANAANATVQITVTATLTGLQSNTATATATEFDPTAPNTANQTTQVNAAVCTNPPAGMVGWWPGDGNADDIQGPTFENGTLQGGATFAAGKVDQAFSLNGTTASIQVADAAPLRLGAGEITIDAWVQASAGSTFRGIVGKNDTAFPYGGYFLRITDDNKVEFAATDCGTTGCGFGGPGSGFAKQPVRSVSVVADGTFHHVAGVRRANGDREIYVDGVLENTRNETMWNTDNSNALYIGDYDGGGSQRFAGLIDEPELFNTALSQAQITAIYNSSFAGKCRSCTSPPSGMLSWWNAEGDAEDLAGTNDGTLQNGATFGAGKVGQAFDFDGADDYVSIAPNTYDGLTDLTVDGWVRFDRLNHPTSDGQAIISALHGGVAHYFTFMKLNTGQLTVALKTSSDCDFTATPSVALETGRFYHLAVTKSGSTLKFYVDGTEIFSQSQACAAGPIASNGGSTRIGAADSATPTDPDRELDGAVDELEIFSRALSATEIAALADAGNAGKCHTSTLQFNSATYSVGENVAGGNAIITVSRNGAHDTLAHVDYATVTGGTAMAGAGPGCAAGDDYITTSGTLDFAPGETSKTFNVPICNESAFENDETVNLQLSNVTGTSAALGSPSTAVLTILSCASPPSGMVNWWNAGGNANDIMGTNNGTLQNGATFGAGKVGQAFDFDGADDYVAIAPNTFDGLTDLTVDGWVRFDRLNHPTSDGQAIISALHGGVAHYFTFMKLNTGQLTVALKTSAFGNCEFIATPSIAIETGRFYHLAVTKSGSTIKFYVDGNEIFSQAQACAAGPIASNGGSTRIGAADSPTPANPDRELDGAVDELEIFNRALSQPEIAALVHGDSAGKCHTNSIQFSSATYSGSEADPTVTITATRSGAHDTQATVQYDTVPGGTATAGATCTGGADYQTTTGTLIFPANSTASQSFTVPLCEDSVFESNETVNLLLSNPQGTGTALGTPIASVLTIIDNDTAPTFSIDDVTHNEGHLGTTSYTFTVTKTGGTEVAASVQFQTNDGSATLADNDYQTNSGTLNFTPAQTTQQITVLVNGDTAVEPDEAFTVNLFNPVAATITDADATGTITNDDFVFAISGRVLYRDSVTAAKNVTMTLTGTGGFVTQMTTTNASGDYLFSNIPAGNDYTLTPSKTGDVNGIESFDAARVARFVAGLELPTATEAIAADADGDGIRTSLDAALIARRVAGLPGFGIVGTWKFVPINRTYPSLGADQTNQNFTAILVGDTSGNWVPALPSGGGDDNVQVDLFRRMVPCLWETTPRDGFAAGCEAVAQHPTRAARAGTPHLPRRQSLSLNIVRRPRMGHSPKSLERTSTAGRGHRLTSGGEAVAKVAEELAADEREGCGNLSFSLRRPFMVDASSWKASRFQASDSGSLPLTLSVISNNFSAVILTRNWY